MGKELFELAILISLKDAASAGADRVRDRLVAMGKEGRESLKTFDSLRRDLKQGLVLGGIGVAGLMALRGGVKSAGDFEAAMADLRLSIEETGKDGKLNLAKLGDEMNRFEVLGMSLGNQLPGTTQDFIEMFSTLKQGGLDAQTILGGTGQAVAHLAVVTGQVPKALAEPFAQYVQQFKLTGDEATKLSNVLAKLKFTTGLNPQELIEGSKFFQLRAGAVLGMTGLQGAEQSGRLLATLRRSGLEGGIGGRELAGMFAELTFRKKEQKKMLAELKGEGINLEFFDTKGSFKGIDNAFAQMEKLRGMSTKKKSVVLDTLFGKEAAGPANIMIEAGAEGWKKTNAEIDRSSSLQDKINEKVGTYNAKMESVLGTIENLKVTTFTPMLDQLKPVLDTANKVVGALQEWGKAHPEIAKIGVDLFAVSSAAMAVVGGFKAMRAAWGLWKIAGSGNLPGLFNQTAAGAGAATTKVGGLSGAMGRIPTVIKSAIAIAGIEYAIQKVWEIKSANDAYVDSLRELKGVQEGGLKSYDALKEELRKQGKPMPEQIEKTAAISSWQSINLPKDLLFFLGAWRGFDQTKQYQQRAPELGRAGVMTQFLKLLESGQLKGTEGKREQIKGALEKAFPESFKEATQRVNELKEGAQSLVPQLRDSTTGLREMIPELQSLKGETSGSTTALRDFKGYLKTFKPENPFAGGPPLVGVPGVTVPSKASGGIVEQSGLVHIHAGETIVPARVTARYQELRRGSGVQLEQIRPEVAARILAQHSARTNAQAGAVHHHGPINLNIHAAKGSAIGEDPKAFADYALRYITHQLHLQRESR